MDITLFLAQFWGWFLVITAIAYLAGGKSLFRELLRMHEDKGFVFLTGWLTLLMGLVTVLLHNVWTTDSRVIITIAGWAATLKGITRISSPEITQKLIGITFKNKLLYFRIALVIVGLIGAWLLYASS